MVRKLNESKQYCRAHQNYIEVVSDDKVEVDMPDINSFMNITDNPIETHPVVPVEREPRGHIFPVNGANAVMATEIPLEQLQNTLDIVWQLSVPGNVEIAPSTGIPAAKLSTITSLDPYIALMRYQRTNISLT